MLARKVAVASASSSVVSAATSAAAASISTKSDLSDANASSDASNEIKIIFSDLDGTLIHYPKKSPPETAAATTTSNNSKLLKFPPSSTGMRGVISAQTLDLVQEIRRENQVRFVLISGMRTSTLLQRLPYLPRADAYCSENGGRIFYPVEEALDGDRKTNGDVDDVFWVQPKKYNGNGSNTKRDKRFGIREDKAWRQKMTTAIGGDSFGSFSLNEIYNNQNDPASTTMPLHERDGFLWDFARDLMATYGFVLDIKGYSTCFRVNRKQQTATAAATAAANPIQVLALLDNLPWVSRKGAIASSVNLSCIDFYPSCSGKKNCCLYLASKFYPEECQQHPEENGGLLPDQSAAVQAAIDAATAAVELDLGSTTTPSEDFLSNHAVCLCDDDNDLEMALACGHAYLPDVSSESMRQTVESFPDHFTMTFSGTENEDGSPPTDLDAVVEGTDASDVALTMLKARILKGQQKPQQQHQALLQP